MSVSGQALYELRFDQADPEQWFLGAPKDLDGRHIDARIFTLGKPYGEIVDESKRAYLEASGLSKPPAPETLSVPIETPGHPLDFNFAAFNMLVVTHDLGELIESMSPGDVERIPVRVEGSRESYEILNVLARIDCIDRDRTIADYWPEGTAKAGEYRMVVRLALDPSRVPDDIKIFQVGGWEVSVVVTEDLKEALEGVSGLTFKPVSGDLPLPTRPDVRPG